MSDSKNGWHEDRPGVWFLYVQSIALGMVEKLYWDGLELHAWRAISPNTLAIVWQVEGVSSYGACHRLEESKAQVETMALSILKSMHERLELRSDFKETAWKEESSLDKIPTPDGDVIVFPNQPKEK